MLGGVLLENNEGDIRVDLTYETLLNSIKQDKVAEITKSFLVK
jgi:vacuolar-type H+-ATPase subunit E/Vma4